MSTRGTKFRRTYVYMMYDYDANEVSVQMLKSEQVHEIKNLLHTFISRLMIYGNPL